MRTKKTNYFEKNTLKIKCKQN